MKRQIVTIPLRLMRLLEVNWDIDWRGAPGAENTSGGTQVVYNAFPQWVGEPKFRLPREELGSYRAHRWQAQGRVGIYRMPMVDPELFRLAAVQGWQDYGSDGVPFSNGQRFSNGMGFAFRPFVTAADDVPAGSLSLTVEVPNPSMMPVVGQIMSHNDWPFGVVAVRVETGLEVRLDVQMPLRRSIAGGDPISLMGTGLFEALDDQTGALKYSKDGIGRPVLKVREVLNR